MAVRNYRGRAQHQQQRHQYTFTDTDNADTYILTLTNGNSNITDAETWTNGASESTTSIAAGIAALIEKSTGGLFARLSATANGAVLEVSSKYAGEPFSLAFTGTATAPTLVVINENGGPLDFNCESNWDEGAVAGSGDDIIFHSSCGFNVYKSGTTFGKISTSLAFPAGATIGAEGTPFKCVCTGLDVNGSGVTHFDINNSAITPNYRGNGSHTLIGSAIANINVFDFANIAVAPYAGQTSAITADATVYGGLLTLGGATTLGGEVIVKAGHARIISTATVDQLDIHGGATAFVDPNADVTVANNYGGNLQYDRSSAAIATLNEFGGSVFVPPQS